MPGIVQVVESIIGNPLKEVNGQTIWAFDATKIEDGVLHSLIVDHLLLSTYYSLLCVRLSHATVTDEKSAEALTNQLSKTLAWAQLLARIYHECLYVPQEVERLQEQQDLFRELLALRNIKFSENPPKYQINHFSSFFATQCSSFFSTECSSFFSTKTLRTEAGRMNLLRLFIVRFWKVLKTFEPLLKNLVDYVKSIPLVIFWKDYAVFIDFLKKYFAPVLNYLSWIAFAPRLIINIFLFCKHLIPGCWMDKSENDVDWLIRLQAQSQRRWFETTNDFIWFLGGLFCCFLLIGALEYVAIYLTLALFFADIIITGVRLGIELYRLNQIEQSLMEEGATPEQLRDFEERYSYEQKRLLLSFATAIFLCLGMLYTLSFFAAYPIIPFLGAVVVLAITCYSYHEGKKIEAQKPSENLDNLKTLTTDEKLFRLFKPVELKEIAESPSSTPPGSPARPQSLMPR